MKKRILTYLANKLALPLGVLALVLLGYILVNSQFGSDFVGNMKGIAGLIGSRKTAVVTPAPVVVEKLKKLNRLETIRQVTSQIVEAKSNSSIFPDFLAMDSLQMMVYTVAVGGVDLSKISETDVLVEPGEIILTLPQPELFDVKVDDNNSKVFARERGIFMFNPDKDLERQARITAQSNARQTAFNSELMDQARTNAEEGLRNLLESLGFEKITFEWASV